MTLTLVLVRHGETLFNQRGLMQGWVDSPLTARGQEQARRVADELAGLDLAAIYASTSGRAVDTAEAIAERHDAMPVRQLRGLRELHFGDSEALPNADVWRERDAAVFFRELIGGRGDGLPGGESGAAYRERIHDAFDQIVRAHPDGTVVVVSHGVTLATYLWTVGWQTPGPVPNCSISIVEVDGSDARIVALNEERLPR